MKKIGIIGSRRRDSAEDMELCRKVFNELYEDGDIIVSGHCPRGGDRFAEVFAKELNLTEKNGKLILHRPDWEANGKAAGFVRNTFIAEDSDIIIAVVAADRTGGTEDTIKKAIKMNKKIILVPQINNNEIWTCICGKTNKKNQWCNC
jgi:predicted Rossmann fold nucleotide-binding protein DprA/Smf involved in DNA uptake